MAWGWLVLAVGALAHSPAPSVAATGPKLIIEREIQEVGQVVRGTPVEVRFALKNAGGAELRVLKADPG